jgi:hypothetical protein
MFASILQIEPLNPLLSENSEMPDSREPLSPNTCPCSGCEKYQFDLTSPGRIHGPPFLPERQRWPSSVEGAERWCWLTASRASQ